MGIEPKHNKDSFPSLSGDVTISWRLVRNEECDDDAAAAMNDVEAVGEAGCWDNERTTREILHAVHHSRPPNSHASPRSPSRTWIATTLIIGVHHAFMLVVDEYSLRPHDMKHPTSTATNNNVLCLLGETQSVVISVNCLSVCLSTGVSRKYVVELHTKFSVHVDCCSSRLCDTLCTSGFVDDISFSRNEPLGTSCVYSKQQ